MSYEGCLLVGKEGKTMKIIEAGYEILSDISDGGIKELQHIERIGRICYKSEDKIKEDGSSARIFVAGLIKRGHEAMLEHSSLSVLFHVDRGVTHELVRHRLMSFAQESTRYCNYSNDKFGNEITVVRPPFWDNSSIEYDNWEYSCMTAEKMYMAFIDSGISPQEARTVLPNSTKADIVLTGNYREWRHFFWLRAADKTGAAHPQMHEVAQPLLEELHDKIPVIFDDIYDVMIANMVQV